MDTKVMWIIFLFILAVFVGGFLIFTSVSDSPSDTPQGIVVVDSPESSQVVEETNDETVDETTTDISTTDSSTSQETSQPAQETKEFDVIAQRFEFSPSIITVNEGDKVILNIQSIDVTHGFSLPDFGVSEQLVSGNTVRVEFTADKKGTFSFFCIVFCGSGHGSMRGTLVVQ